MVWRDRDTLQIGIDPRRAVALTGMRGAARLVGLLDGSREHHQVLAAAQDQGISPAAADRIIGLLAAAGVLADFPAAALRGVPDGTRTRLAGELATVSLAHGFADGGACALARRQAAEVRVYGVGPVGSGIASLLTASGVGHVVCTGPVGRPATQHDRPARPPVRRARRPASQARPASPARLEPVARQTAPARRDVPARPASSARPGTAAPPGRADRGRRPDLAVLTDSYPPELPAALVADQVVHLAASASEAIGVVGPLVVPAETACLSCVDLARTDRDPAWPLILAQLAAPGAPPAACNAALATAVAAQAATQALAFLDRAGAAEAVRNGTLELVLPGWQWRRRSWRLHDGCRCSTQSATCPRM
jgi:hypothetical protein